MGFLVHFTNINGSIFKNYAFTSVYLFKAVDKLTVVPLCKITKQLQEPKIFWDVFFYETLLNIEQW